MRHIDKMASTYYYNIACLTKGMANFWQIFQIKIQNGIKLPQQMQRENDLLTKVSVNKIFLPIESRRLSYLGTFKAIHKKELYLFNT